MTDMMDNVWDKMKIIYRKMDLSEEEIVERILCKTTRVIEGRDNLAECDT